MRLGDPRHRARGLADREDDARRFGGQMARRHHFGRQAAIPAWNIWRRWLRIAACLGERRRQHKPMTPVWKARGRKALVWTLRIVAGILALPLLYLLVAIFLGLVPANVSFRQPTEGGVLIYVRSNGVHTDIVMPKVNAEADWRPYADPSHLRDPRWGGADHVAIGYGARDFYLNTPTWGDLSLAVAFRSMTGGDTTLVHLEHVDRPERDDLQRPIRLSSDQYRRLAAFSARASGPARTAPRSMCPAAIPMPTPSTRAMAASRCSTIATPGPGAALRAAGVRMGLWTPFEQSVMWRLD